jgi:hypothetical protein
MAHGGGNMLWGSNKNNNNKSLQLRLLVYCMNDFYVYVTQQDTPHSDKILKCYLDSFAALDPRVYSATKQKWVPKPEIKMFLCSRGRQVRKADNLAAICKPTV